MPQVGLPFEELAELRRRITLGEQRAILDPINGGYMTILPKTAAVLPMIVPFSERLSETWLLERTYHAQLRNGKELSVPDLTRAMKQLNDFDVLLFLQSSKSKLAERLPLKKSTNFYVPLSTWREISQEEASATSQQGIPNNRDNCQLSQRCR